MKKSLKLILSLTLSAAMVFAFTGCSEKKSETPPTTSTPEATPQTTPQIEETVSKTPEEKSNYKIGIIQFSEHAALTASNSGFVQALSDAGYKDGENITIDNQNAQNDQSNLKTISQRFVQNNSDLILAIATPSALSAANETTDIPILCTAVTDYMEAGLISSNENPATNVSGTSDRTPVKEQFDLMMKILPDTKKVGIMYNSSEVNSEIQAKLAEEACRALNLEYEFGTVTNTNDIAQAVQSIAGRVDALYVPTDNTFATSIATVSQIAEQEKLPVIVGENGMCQGGGLATVGIDYQKLGYQTGQMAVRVLKGEDITTMPIEFTDITDICINLDVAKAIGIEIPKEVLDSASITVENGEMITKIKE